MDLYLTETKTSRHFGSPDVDNETPHKELNGLKTGATPIASRGLRKSRGLTLATCGNVELNPGPEDTLLGAILTSEHKRPLPPDNHPGRGDDDAEMEAELGRTTHEWTWPTG